jgi:hypothetical protein
MLAVTASLQLGSKVYDSHAASIRLRRGLLPIVDRLEVDLPPGVEFDAEPGDDALLELDGGEGAAKVFTGKISTLRRTLRGLHVTAHDGALLLGRYRPSMALEQVSAGDVVERLCRDAGVDTGDVASGPQLNLYVANGRSTALGEIARLAAHFGGFAAFDGEGKLHVFTSPDAGPAEELALKYGREIVDVQVERFVADTASRTVIGDGADSPGGQQARWPVSDFYGGAADEPGPTARRRAEPELRTVDDARAASSAWAARQAAREVLVRLHAWLLPGVAPGGRVQLQEMPSAVDVSACCVRQVLHRIDPSLGAFTDAWATEDAGGAGGMGGLAAAVGGLL